MGHKRVDFQIVIMVKGPRSFAGKDIDQTQKQEFEERAMTHSLLESYYEL